MRRMHKHETTAQLERHRRHRARIHRARLIAETGLDALALASLLRRIGPRRFVRVAALATEGYLGYVSGTGSRRRPRAH